MGSSGATVPSEIDQDLPLRAPAAARGTEQQRDEADEQSLDGRCHAVSPEVRYGRKRAKLCHARAEPSRAYHRAMAPAAATAAPITCAIAACPSYCAGVRRIP
jgi:hypothetical protein